MFFKKESHNLLLIFGIAFVILCMCKKKVSGFETNDHREEINEYFSRIRTIQDELNSQIDEFENFIHPRPGVTVRDTAIREDTETEPQPPTAQSPPPPPPPVLPAPTPAPSPVPAAEPAAEPEEESWIARGGIWQYLW